jgi:hypothetical protein
MLNGLQSDPDQPGVEKFVVAEVDDRWLSQKRHHLGAADLGLGLPNTLMHPQGLFAVKGWNRSVCCLAVLKAAHEIPELLQVRPTGMFFRFNLNLLFLTSNK